ncbi:Ulp1 peptidase [Ranunculus cassubicifolius]
MNRRSRRKDFKAFEFQAQDEQIELVSIERLEKFSSLRKQELRTPKVEDNSPIRKYQFLQTWLINIFQMEGHINSKTKPSLFLKETLENCLEDSSSDRDSDGGEMENMDVGVDVSPDYLIYKDMYCTDSLLCFLSSCMKLEGVNTYGNKENFSFEWGLTDVIRIESQWFAGMETAAVKLLIRTDADLEDENPDDTSELVELKFAVSDPNWFESQAKIMSMDARYKDIWGVLLHTDEDEEDPSAGMNHMGESKSYFPIFDDQFEDVIYPKGDPDAVSISKRDVELLQPETFVNDTIIDFYIKYLKNKMSPEEGSRFHFFNSFFFRKLADLDKNPSSASEGRAAFLRVRKWTRKVNLFEKDYVFIPVNFNLHWSLIVICHPGEVPTFEDEEVDIALKVPCILHMDSIKGSHKGLKDLVQSYLWEEWKERHPDHEPSDDLSSKFSNLRFVPLELPQQENSFDCGLFLLHYVEQFLEDAPNHFHPSTIIKSSNFLNLNWFEPAEASLKRVYIQRLIYHLLKDRPQEIPENNNVKESGVELFTNEKIAANPCNGFLSNDEGIQIKLLGNPDPRHQYVGNSGLELKELFETGTTSESGLFPNGGQNGTFDRLLSFNTTEGDEYAVSGFNMYDPFLSSSIQQGQNDNEYASCDVSSNCGSQSSLEEEMVHDEKVHDTQEEFRLVSPENNNNHNLSGSELSEDTRVVEDSQEVDDGEKRSFMACEENHLGETEDLRLDERRVKRPRLEENIGFEIEL